MLIFDPSIVSYETLVKFFFKIHDATSLNRQGRNSGLNYRSAIFFHSSEQEAIAKATSEKVGRQWFYKPVTTLIVQAGIWWDAEEYHQLYLDKNPDGYHCETHFIRDFPELE